jgi:16S rRNA (guanine1207-N2)-methyltransferase
MTDDDSERDHYFRATPSGPGHRRDLEVVLAGRTVRVVTDDGVFSGHRVDLGTQVLLRAVPAPSSEGHLLDLGCGWGPITLTLAMRAPRATVWAVDVNERAIGLTVENAARLALGGVRACTPPGVPQDIHFSDIWSNPPIRIGKDALHLLLSTWLPRLTDTGRAHLVVQRNLGADSLLKWLDTELGPTGLHAEKIASAKGYRVIRVSR